MKELTEAVERLDPILKGVVFPVESAFEGTQALESNEFDFNVELETFSNKRRSWWSSI